MPELSSRGRPGEDNMPEQAKSNNKRLALHLLAAAVPFGIIDGLTGLPETEPRLLTLAEGNVINFILFYWFLVDAQIRDYKASGLLKVMVVCLAPIALCWYLLRTREALECIRYVGYAVGLLIVSGAASVIIGLATFGLVELGGLR
jgi:hypothetical protein